MGMIGFVGLGRMGRPMASNLTRKGFRLAVHDINRDAVAELELLQAKGVASVAEATRGSEIVVTMLPNSAVVTAIVAGEGGILQHATRGTLIMDMSTVSPETTDALTAKAAEKGIAFVDAPVGRLAAHADRGESLFMVGASASDFERVKPLLEAMGNTIYHCGPVVARQGEGWKVTAAGPTTSIREEPYQGDIVRKYGVRAVMGKGGMGPKTLAALKDAGAVYLNAIGGAAQFYARCIESVDGVSLLEFGTPEAMWHLTMRDFPAIVTMDAHGNSLHKDIEDQSGAELQTLATARF